MTEEEQELYLDKLVLRERKLKKRLACLRSRARKTRRAVSIALEPLRGCEIDFEYVRKIYSEATDTDFSPRPGCRW